MRGLNVEHCMFAPVSAACGGAVSGMQGRA